VTATPAIVVIAEELVRLEGRTQVRIRAEQTNGHTMVHLVLLDGRTLTGTVQLHPHQVAEVVRALDRIAHAAGVRR
jgi:hypothetical protein